MRKLHNSSDLVLIERQRKIAVSLLSFCPTLCVVVLVNVWIIHRKTLVLFCQVLGKMKFVP